MRITNRYIEDEIFESTNEHGHVSRQDMRPVGKKQHLSPVETVLSCLASCVAVEIVSIIKKKRKIFKDLIIELDGVRNENHPRSLTHIHMHFILVSPDTTAETLDKTAKMVIDNYCSVADSLRADIEYSVEVRPE